MGLKDVIQMFCKGSSQVKNLQGKVVALEKEINALQKAGNITGREAAALESGLNGAKMAGRVGDEVVVLSAKAAKGTASSVIKKGNTILHDLTKGMKLNPNRAYRSTSSDVIKIGNTELSLSDPRIIKALETKGCNGQITIGRGAHCDVVINDPLVSSEHLFIQAKCPGSKRLYIEDLNSTNGTTIIKTNKYTPADRSNDSKLFDKYLNKQVKQQDDIIADVVVEPVPVKVKAKPNKQAKQEEVIPEPVAEDIVAKHVNDSYAQMQRIAEEQDMLAQQAYYLGAADDVMNHSNFGIIDDIIDIF